MSDVLELLKRQEDLEAMIQAQTDRFTTLQKRKTKVGSEPGREPAWLSVLDAHRETLFFSEGGEAGPLQDPGHREKTI